MYYVAVYATIRILFYMLTYPYCNSFSSFMITTSAVSIKSHKLHHPINAIILCQCFIVNFIACYLLLPNILLQHDGVVPAFSILKLLYDLLLPPPSPLKPHLPFKKIHSSYISYAASFPST